MRYSVEMNVALFVLSILLIPEFVFFSKKKQTKKSIESIADGCKTTIMAKLDILMFYALQKTKNKTKSGLTRYHSH